MIRVKRTSIGICSRDCVAVKMFSGEKEGRVERSESNAIVKSIVSARFTYGGIFRIDLPFTGPARMDL
mgnify:CR=1 FL=1